MKSYVLLGIGLAGFFLLGFWIFPETSISVFDNPGAVEGIPKILLAAISILLLVSDVLLPVPASVVMLANGVLFGFLPGASISLCGAMGASLLGFTLGRVGTRFVEPRISAFERARFDALLGRWGILAIAITRPVPIVAETVSILAGTSSMRLRGYSFASLLGTMPTAVLYAYAGSGIWREVSAIGQMGALAAVVLFAVGAHLVRQWLHR
jgi:uncharacterized membrane protein YdjX (TVP38/TMEM64 family)